MKILILEDDDIRIKLFKRNLIGCDVVATDKVQECIELLIEREWDVLFLDHDLGGGVFLPSDENSGCAVAKWLSEHVDKKPKEIFIHSLNPGGADRMKAHLPEAVLSPFAWQSVKIIEGKTLEEVEKKYEIEVRKN